MTWERTSDYFTKKKRKDYIGTAAFTYKRVFRQFPNGTFNIQFPAPSQSAVNDGYFTSDVGATYWTIPAYSFFNVLDVPSIVNQFTSTRLLNLVKDMKVNLAQCFAERAQTADLIAVTATRLAKSFIQLKHGNLPGALNQLGAGAPSKALSRAFKAQRGKSADIRASNTWLEIQYGWLPLLSDVYGSAQFVAELNSNRPLSRKVSCTYFVSDSSKSKVFVGLNNGASVEHTFTGKLAGKQSVTFSITNQAAKDMSSAGILNPLELAWELLPYSFVVDWFLPVGNFLSAFDATAGCTFLGGARSFRMTSIVDSSALGLGTGPYQYFGQGVSFQEVVDLGRQGLTSWPPNVLPSFKNPLGMKHVANALALLTTAFKK